MATARGRRTRRANGTGSITFDAQSKRWVARLTLPTGKRTRVTARTKTEAEQTLRKLARDAHTPTAQPVTDDRTVGEWLTWWAEAVLPARARSANTVVLYRNWAEHLLPLLGHHRLTALRTEHVESALADARNRLTGGPLSRRSLVGIRNVLAMACDEAIRRGHITVNPARLAVLPAGTAMATRRASFTADQARTLLREAKGTRHEALWTLALMRGLRPGELLGLTWRDVDLDGAQIHLREAGKWERGEQGGERFSLGPLKAGARRRTLALPDPVVRSLRHHREEQWEARATLGRRWVTTYDQHDGLVFTTLNGGPLSRGNVRRSFKALCASAGIEGNWTTYQLRHAAVSLLSDAGVPADVIADLLGHVDTRMVFHHYRNAVTPVVDGGASEMTAIFER